MASHPSSFTVISLLMLVLLISLPSVLTENSVSQTFATVPDIMACGPRVLPLLPCAPFVQGSVPSPDQVCCDGLIDVYDQHPNCVCMLLDDNTTSVFVFPINHTLALQLPLICKLGLKDSICPGLASPPSPSSPESQVSPPSPIPPESQVSPPSPIPPESQVSPGPTANTSSNAVPPVAAKPGMSPNTTLGFRFHDSAAEMLVVKGKSLVLVATTFLLILII